MKHVLVLLVLTILANMLFAQYTYTIKADSVKITNCDSSELIIENHTQGISGFLFNTGRGRTIFKKGVVKVNGGLYLIGADTLNLNANAWMQGGNSFGATGVLGTLDNHHLDFYTNDIQRVRLDSAGNLLLGTVTDNGISALQVNGAIYGSYFTNSPTVLGPSGAASGSGAVRLRWGSSDGVYAGFYFQSRPNRRAYFATPSDTRPFYINDSIGVTFGFTPFVAIGGEDGLGSGRLTILNVYGSTIDALNVGHTNADTTNTFDFAIKKTGNVVVGGGDNGNKFQVTGNMSAIGSVGIGTSSPTAQLHTTGSVRFAGLTNDSLLTQVLVCDANGNLYYRSASSLAANGILNSSLAGEPTINSSLAVNGEIRAERLRLRPTQWADYVFADGYRLPSLSEVGRYIKQNNHLPGMPPASEVRKKGIDVGDNQAALLKKIEELTLYMLEQEKRLELQQEEIGELKKQNKDLQALKLEMTELRKLIKK